MIIKNGKIVWMTENKWLPEDDAKQLLTKTYTYKHITFTLKAEPRDYLSRPHYLVTATLKATMCPLEAKATVRRFKISMPSILHVDGETLYKLWLIASITGFGDYKIFLTDDVLYVKAQPIEKIKKHLKPFVRLPIETGIPFYYEENETVYACMNYGYVLKRGKHISSNFCPEDPDEFVEKVKKVVLAHVESSA